MPTLNVGIREHAEDASKRFDRADARIPVLEGQRLADFFLFLGHQKHLVVRNGCLHGRILDLVEVVRLAWCCISIPDERLVETESVRWSPTAYLKLGKS